MDLTDTTYEVENGLARITINRPERMNAFRARTIDELIHLFTRAWASTDVGVICLTGAGEHAFSTGGDHVGCNSRNRLPAGAGEHMQKGVLALLARRGREALPIPGFPIACNQPGQRPSSGLFSCAQLAR